MPLLPEVLFLLGRVGVDPRLRRSYAAPAGSVALLPGVGANPSLRRDRAAPAGCKASGLCSQVGVELDLFSSCFQPCMSPIDRHRLVSDVLHGRCTSVAPDGTSSCGFGHGNSHVVVHESSCVMVHGNSSQEVCMIRRPSSPGPGREVRSWVGWTRLGKTARCGVWLFWGALQEE